MTFDSGAPVTLREITGDTVRAITRLAVGDEQTGYVASNAVSLAQALFHRSAWYRAVYAADVPVGFVMLDDETLLTVGERPAAPQLGLWRFMIDRQAQGRGFGRAALRRVIDHARTRPGISRLTTSCVPGPASPRGFYERLGFVATGELDDDEEVLALALAPTVAAAAAPDRAAALALAERLIRNFDTAATQHELRAPLYDSWCARLATGTAAQKLGASIDTVAPGRRSCPYHLHHAQEEMFIVLEGSGTLRVAGELLPLQRHDVVFIPPGPDYPHQLINTSDAPLTYLSISTRDTPEIVEYPDSDKYLAIAGAAGAGDAAGARPFDAIQRRTDTLDYWDGEP